MGRPLFLCDEADQECVEVEGTSESRGNEI